jgi:hypothetical protein
MFTDNWRSRHARQLLGIVFASTAATSGDARDSVVVTAKEGAFLLTLATAVWQYTSNFLLFLKKANAKVGGNISLDSPWKCQRLKKTIELSL